MFGPIHFQGDHGSSPARSSQRDCLSLHPSIVGIKPARTEVSFAARTRTRANTNSIVRAKGVGLQLRQFFTGTCFQGQGCNCWFWTFVLNLDWGGRFRPALLVGIPIMAEGAYGQRLSKRVGAEVSATLGLDSFPKSGIAVTRVAWEERREARYAAMPLEGAFLVCLDLRDLASHPYWVGGRATEMPRIGAGEFTLLDLRQQHASELRTALDRLVAYLPNSALTHYADEHETTPVSEFRIPPAQVFDDPVIRGLLTALLPALERRQEANRLFLDHVALALVAHMAATYGDAHSDKRRDLHGGLAAWQERRAKDALQASISSGITLEDLATLCGLSRSHFARAFKQSTGLPPHRWLLARRVEKAQDLLLHSTMPLEKIATSCGFADQGHLSRVFSRQVGTSPGAWRRLRRT